MQPEDIKQWLDILHSGGDLALAIGLYFAQRIAKSVSKIAKAFTEMHEDIKYIRERTEKETVRLERIHSTF